MTVYFNIEEVLFKNKASKIRKFCDKNVIELTHYHYILLYRKQF